MENSKHFLEELHKEIMQNLQQIQQNKRPRF